MLRYAVTIFLSAFLLLQVQPLISKIILPWFGGGPSVWTACMVFFQVALVAGYAYAHAVNIGLSQRKQVVLHLAVLAAALLVLPIQPSARWKPLGSENPTWRILLLLGATVGLPYLVLSTTGPLLQAWFSRTHEGRSPYRLYALSNAGSLLALVTFPFVVEPWLSSSKQALVWSGGFALFALVCGYCAVRTWNVRAVPQAAPPASAPEAEDEAAARPDIWARMLWVGLPACSTALLLAITSRICLDVAVVPFLWVLPFALYLLSFILCFSIERLYYRPVFWPAFLLSLAGIVWLMTTGVDASVGQLLKDLRLDGVFPRWSEVNASIYVQVIGFSLGLFVCCMLCHGELVRLKPRPRYLTSFYLLSAVGGAVGGVFVGVIAPRIFNLQLELHLGLWTCLAMGLEALWYDMKPHLRWRHPWLAWPCLLVSVFALIALGEALRADVKHTVRGAVSISRSFYGVLSVFEMARDNPDLHRYELYNGRIDHGCQLLAAEGRTRPTSYYGPHSGLGLALRHFPRHSGLRVGVIGLGTGTIAAYGQRGDHYTFYEIDPAVLRLAQTRFTYLRDLKARGGDGDVVLGDARLSLERQDPQGFDVLAIDAFTSDAIPAHLLTREAFGLYLRHLKADGVIAVHISNRHLDLRPIVWAAAEVYKLRTALIESRKNKAKAIDSASWVLVTANREFLSQDALLDAAEPETADRPPNRLWTDDYSNLFQILN